MMGLSAKLSRVGISLALAIALAFLSVHVEHVGPEVAEYGNLCGPNATSPCYKQVLEGGFPAAYLFDAPGVSVERQLSFGEDQLFVRALVLDIAFYFVIALLGTQVISRRCPTQSAAAGEQRTN